VASTLAYYDTATITAIKSFIVQALGNDIEQNYKHLQNDAFIRALIKTNPRQT
jgi:hypothetical protein